MSVRKTINPASPVPLYHQIAQVIRQRIELGELVEGDYLESLRSAAQHWNVNFHTVRHAYAELARVGLIEIRGPRGTRVIASINPTNKKADSQAARPADVDEFVRQTISQSQTLYGLNVDELIAKINSSQARGGERVYVLECSQYQCEDLSRQLEAAWAVEAVPYCLDSDDELPQGNLVATYFHYNEIRLRWPRRLTSFSFISIAPDQQLVNSLHRVLTPRSTLTVCERDEPTAQVVIADVSAILTENKYSIRSHIVNEGNKLPAVDENEILLLPPRLWGVLSTDQKKALNLVEVSYSFDREELDQLGASFGWTRAFNVQSKPATGEV